MICFPGQFKRCDSVFATDGDGDDGASDGPEHRRVARRDLEETFDTPPTPPVAYVAVTEKSAEARILDRELKKGSAELVILAILEPRPRHGYEIGTLIETRSHGQLRFHVASLYPLLYRLEERGWLQGRWVERAGERRRRFYSLTPAGRRVLASQRKTWKSFVQAIELITGGEPA